MLYYVTWTDRDVNYQDYDNDCNMMVSPRNVHKKWSFNNWENFPKKIIVDCGAIQYIKDKEIPKSKEVLNSQLNLFKNYIPNYNTSITFCSPDVPLIPNNISKIESLERIKKTIENAEKYFNLVLKLDISLKFDLIGVIQSFDSETAYYSAKRLSEIGYKRFGIGSLIPLIVKKDKNKIFRIIEAVIEAVGNRVHVFGITSPSLISKLKSLKIESIDSATPMREAFNGSINYSKPFRRCKFVNNVKTQELIRNYGYSIPIDKLEKCNCPICRENPNRLLLGGTKENINWKAIHNYFHLKWEIQS